MQIQIHKPTKEVGAAQIKFVLRKVYLVVVN